MTLRFILTLGLALSILLNPVVAHYATSAAPISAHTASLPAADAGTYSLSLSKSANRSAAVDLQGQTVSGDIYVFVSPESGIKRVNFFLDNPAATGTPVQTETGAPYDFQGGNSTTATPYDTRKLANGAHSITASISLKAGGVVLTTASFTVNNASATNTPTPAPGATATRAATATPAKQATATPTKQATATATKQATATPTKQATATATKQPTATPTRQPTTTAVSPSGSIYWGVSLSGVPGDPATLSNWERDVAGKAVSIVHWGHKWADSSNAYRAWSSSAANSARSHGSIPMISWTPQGGDNSKFQLSDIINGAHDGYIRDFATSAKNWGYPYMLRIMHEMNGAWDYPWQEDENGNARGQFVQAWRHIVDIFRQQGATNVSYIWCPSADWNGSPRPSYASLYPGDSYVDWTCLDGYNFGTNANEGWQTFDQVYNYSYNEVLKVAPNKPLVIGEFGSVEQGGSKANWFTDALKTQIPGRYPRIRAAVYFNWNMDGDDWRIETSSASKAAWRAGIASAYYYANQFGSITGKVAVP